ncbi:hypothetical protein IGI04_002438 [Brassica rapa subsp. trilocularis]|uniref:Uncharacterized protein n=1 Tax=Brassica rapa subsp. trilocularis TaxID=1813537 RepID=A0ABQ7NVI9_BRACM|nr:hypothetical protein IGI04_002438 [Brassica rapa subsp. trilocularis]
MRGRSIQKRRTKIRGAGKIESRRVFVGRGRNTLQGKTASKEPDVEHTRAGDSIGMQEERGGNALEVYGTSNRTHGDVGYVDMCVLNRVLGNRCRKWERGGCFNWCQSQSVLKETPISSKVSAGMGSTNKSSNYDMVEFYRSMKGLTRSGKTSIQKDHLLNVVGA